MGKKIIISSTSPDTSQNNEHDIPFPYLFQALIKINTGQYEQATLALSRSAMKELVKGFIDKL